jgi:hypothetical protein
MGLGTIEFSHTFKRATTLSALVISLATFGENRKSSSESYAKT